MLEKRQVPLPEGTDAKEVFSFFGLAIYSAQIFEKGILNLLVALKRLNLTTITPEIIDSIYESYDTSTLGRLLHETRNLHSFDKETEDKIIYALNRRNHLAHDFFWYHSENFMTDDGREFMINELIRDIKHFDISDQQITELYFSISLQFGLTEQNLEQLYEAELNRIKNTKNA